MHVPKWIPFILVQSIANIQTPSSPAFDLQAIGRIFLPNGDMAE